MAPSSAAMAAVSSERTAMNASVAPIARHAMATPSTIANGSSVSSARSVPEAGSAP